MHLIDMFIAAATSGIDIDPGGIAGMLVNGGGIGALTFIVVKLMPDQAREHRAAMKEQAEAFAKSLDEQRNAWRDELNRERIVHDAESQAHRDALREVVQEIRALRPPT